MEEYIPDFNLIEKENNNVILKIDEFEEQIEIINKLSKQYDELKKEIKEEMLKVGKENNLDQLKWTTPKGIKITCSIGKPAEHETTTEIRFNEEILKEKYPDIYKECCIERTYEKVIKTASNDRLVITLPKGE